MKTKRKGKIIGILCIVLALVCIVYGVLELLPEWRLARDSERLRDLVVDESGDSAMDREVDWNYLQSVNPDIIAWIYVPGTHIDYPILKGDENNYYLSHSYTGAYNALGSIFTHQDTTSIGEHTILYGHRMNSGQMFGDLGIYEDVSAYDGYPVYVYTPEETRKYQAFVAYHTSKSGATYTPTDMEHREEYYSHIVNEAGLNGVATDTWEKYNSAELLTLSTCPRYGANTKRWVVQCLVVERKQKNE